MKNTLIAVLVVSTTFLVGYLIRGAIDNGSEASLLGSIQTKSEKVKYGKTYDELVAQGDLLPASKIIEAILEFDVDKNPALRVNGVTVKNAYLPSVEEGNNSFFAKIYDTNKKLLSITAFGLPLEIAAADSDGLEDYKQAPRFTKKVKFVVNMPYSSNVDSLSIFGKQGELVTTYRIKGNLKFENNKPGGFYTRNGKEILEKNNGNNKKTSGIFEKVLSVFGETANAVTTLDYFDVVYIGEDWSASQADAYHAAIDAIAVEFLKRDPLAARASQIRIHVVDHWGDNFCPPYSSSEYPYVCQNSIPTVQSTVNSYGVPWDKIIVVINTSNNKGLFWFNAGVGFTSPHAALAAHELSHAMNLRDEYVWNSGSGVIDNQVVWNCYHGTPPAAAWSGIVNLSDYNAGCSYANWYRSSYTSLMHYIVADAVYNQVSKNQINGRLDYYAGPFASPTPQASSTPSVTPTATPTPVFSPTIEPSIMPSQTATPTPSTSSGPSATPTATPSSTPVEPSPTPISTPAPSPSPTPSPTPEIDSTAPTVIITSPLSGAVVGAKRYTINAVASDNVALAKIQISIDSKQVRECLSIDFCNYLWNAAPAKRGTHAIVAKATDTSGNVSNTTSIVTKQ